MVRITSMALIIGLTLSACSFETAFEHSDKTALDCRQLKSKLADAQALQRKVSNEGASSLALLHGGEKPGLVDRFFTRLMVWGSGGQEAAEMQVAESFAKEMTMLSSEIRRRCN